MQLLLFVLNTDVDIESIISLRGKNLNNVNVFKYLGAFINSNQPNTGENEINHRIHLVKVKFIISALRIKTVKIL